MEQLKLNLDALVPLNWRPAGKESKAFCLERIIQHALEVDDTKSAVAAIQEHNRMMGHHAPKQIDVTDERQVARTREEHEQALREAGIDPEIIAAQVLK